MEVYGTLSFSSFFCILDLRSSLDRALAARWEYTDLITGHFDLRVCVNHFPLTRESVFFPLSCDTQCAYVCIFFWLQMNNHQVPEEMICILSCAALEPCSGASRILFGTVRPQCDGQGCHGSHMGMGHGSFADAAQWSFCASKRRP